MTQDPQMVAPDLRLRAPRSPRVRLGLYALLPRMLDKGRATLVGHNGEYNYNCPIDQHLIRYTGIDPELLLAQLAVGHGDAAILEWIEANAQIKREPWEIAQWSAYMETRVPTDADTRAYFNDMHKAAGEAAEDIASWFDLLDLDDYTTFGGKA